MANRIEYTDIDPRRDGLAAPMSRYSDSQVIYYGDIRRITYATYKKTPIPASKNDHFAIVPAGYEFRPDKISAETYGVPDYWWKIMEANNIQDIFDFKAGITIRLPGNIY